jgi:hypothetical protein
MLSEGQRWIGGEDGQIRRMIAHARRTVWRRTACGIGLVRLRPQQRFRAISPGDRMLWLPLSPSDQKCRLGQAKTAPFTA